jgi:hypothetical protein
MTAIRLDDTPRARGGGRLRPPPAWRRWSLVDLARRRLLGELREARTSAREIGDLTLVELLDPVVSALTALVEHPRRLRRPTARRRPRRPRRRARSARR